MLLHLLETLDMYLDQELLLKQPYLLCKQPSGNTPTITLQAGLICVGTSNDTSLRIFNTRKSLQLSTSQVTDSLVT